MTPPNDRRRYRPDRSLDADTPFYGLFLRLAGTSRDNFREAKHRMTEQLGNVPSNPMILDTLLANYLKDGAAK